MTDLHDLDTAYWWLSFADADRPAGQQFLGACVVPGMDFRQAITASHARGLNPGGEVVGLPLPAIAWTHVPPEFRDRLLNRNQAEALDAIMLDAAEKAGLVE